MNTVAKGLLRRLARPTGAGGWRDQLVLSLWEAYANGYRHLPHRHRGRNGEVVGSHRARSPHVDASADPASGTTRSDLFAGEGAERDPSLFKRQLLENILPFWREHSIDNHYGGYDVQLDRTGADVGDGLKYAAMQARMVYCWAVAHELDPSAGYDRLAERGVRFLNDHFWDDRFGGWFSTVHRDGRVCTDHKDAFHQSYVLLGLAAWCRIADDELTSQRIVDTFDLLDRFAWDRDFHGYRWRCARNWTMLLANKTICVQLDMLAALDELDQRAHASWSRRRMDELSDAIINRMRDRRHHCTLEHFTGNWRYDPVVKRDRIEIGHNLKATWLLLEMYELTGEPATFEAAAQILEFCLRFAWDDRFGGFFQHVFRNGRPSSFEKLWWPQAEGMQALYHMHRLTREPRFLDVARQLLAFIQSALVDTEYGGWYTETTDDGRPVVSHKGGVYKAAFHETQAYLFPYRDLSRQTETACESIS